MRLERPLTAMAINSSKSKTGLLTVLQQDQDLRPSWNIYHLRRSGGEGADAGDLPGRQGGRYKLPLYCSRHRTPFRNPCAYIEASCLTRRHEIGAVGLEWSGDVMGDNH